LDSLQAVQTLRVEPTTSIQLHQPALKILPWLACIWLANACTHRFPDNRSALDISP
jgi:hypothetical protein